MEERRRKDDRDWDIIVAHIAETNERSKNMDKTLSSIDEKIKIQNGRITSLELDRAALKGKVAGAGVVGGFVGWVLTLLFRH